MAAKEIIESSGTLDRVAFLYFIRAHIKSDVAGLPAKVDKNKGWTVVDEWIVPPFRYSYAPLVPSADFYPCDLCALARYNTLCAHQKMCASHAYWALLRLEEMFHVKKEGKRGGESSKQREDKRVGHRRSYQKPAAQAQKIGRR